MPLILPLPTAVFQILFAIVSIAIQATTYQRRANMGERRSVEYAAAIELGAMSLGWIAFFVGYDFLPRDIQLDLQRLILRGIWSPDLNNWVLVILPIAFLLGFEVKAIFAQVLDLFLRYPTLTEDDSDPAPAPDSGVSLFKSQMTVFFDRYQRLQSDFEKEAIFIGHAFSSAFGALILGIQMLLAIGKI